jgi:hypothetical protein
VISAADTRDSQQKQRSKKEKFFDSIKQEETIFLALA